MNESSKLVLCPYCGYTQPNAEKCAQCGGLFEPLSRKATQIAMGPWFVRDKRSPFRPGCSYEVLKKQVRAGKVKPNTVIRGPSTHQFWSIARHVQGVAHLVGYCHECGAKVEPEYIACPECAAHFGAPRERDELGLQYPTVHSAGRAQRKLDREIAEALGKAPGRSGKGRPTSSRRDRPARPDGRSGASGAAGRKTEDHLGDDLLGDVIDGESVLVPVDEPEPSSARSTAGDGEQRDGPLYAKLRAKSDAGAGRTDAADDGDPDEAARAAASASPSRLSLTTWLLILVNVVALAALTAVLILFLRQQSSPDAAAPPDGDATVVSVGADDAAPGTEGDPEDGAAGVTNSTTPTDQPPPVELAPTADASTAGAGSAAPADGDQPTGNDAAPPRPKIGEQLARARELEQAGDIEGSLALLRGVDREPLTEREALELDVALARAADRLARSRVSMFVTY